MEQRVMVDYLGQPKKYEYCPKIFKHLQQYFNHRKNLHQEVRNDKNLTQFYFYTSNNS